MERRGRVLGPASTNFNDYVGTVAADDADAVLDRPSLYELAHIDRDRYIILAIDLTVDGPVGATVYAIARVDQEISAPADIADLGQRSGEIPVVPFDLPEPNVEEFIRHALKRISVRLITRDVADQTLVIREPSRTPDLDA
jgi:hypothetical protein